MTNPFDELLGGKDFDLDAFLRALGHNAAERSPRDHLDYAFEALTAARKLGSADAYTRALADFGSAVKRVREARG